MRRDIAVLIRLSTSLLQYIEKEKKKVDLVLRTQTCLQLERIIYIGYVIFDNFNALRGEQIDVLSYQ